MKLNQFTAGKCIFLGSAVRQLHGSRTQVQPRPQMDVPLTYSEVSGLDTLPVG